MRPDASADGEVSVQSEVEGDATLQDMDSIFKPKEGEIWAFYDANLQKLLQRPGSQFVPVSGAGMTINPAFLAMMNRAADFTDAAYQMARPTRTSPTP